MFLAPKVAPMQMSQFHDTYSLIVNGTQSDFQVADHGGAIYELPAATFQQGPSDMPEIEWFSKQAVHPRHTEVFPSSLTAMHHYGVNVYFVDAATYAAIQAAADHGWQILQSLTPFRP